MTYKEITLDDILRKQKNLKSFIFDLDGTLIDSQSGIIATISKLLGVKGYNVTADEISKHFGKPVEVLLKFFAPDLSEEELWDWIKDLRAMYSENHLEITYLFPKSLEVVSALKTRNFKLGVASTKFKKFVTEALDHFQLIDFFDVIVSGYEVENHKPAPDIIFESCKQLNISPNESIYIGDSPSDVMAGKSAGALTLAVLTGPQDINDIIATEPDFIIPDLSYLKI